VVSLSLAEVESAAAPVTVAGVAFAVVDSSPGDCPAGVSVESGAVGDVSAAPAAPAASAASWVGSESAPGADSSFKSSCGSPVADASWSTLPSVSLPLAP